MNNKQFQAEKLYQATMAIARSMMEKGIITAPEYAVITDMMLKKYSPVLGSLISEFSLTF